MATAAEPPPISTDQSEEANNYRKILRIMSSEMDSEKRAMNDFQQQHDKIRLFWGIEKKRLEDHVETERRKLRNLDDLTEKHNCELNAYKMKTYHLLHEQQSR